MLTWQPDGPFERLLQRAYAAGDLPACLDLLRGAELALPLTEAAAAGAEPPAWATVTAADGTWLVAYTSVPGMELATGGRLRHCRVGTLVELAAGWPDPRWRLAVNPGLPVHLELESGTVARLAVPGMAENAAAHPGARPPVLQKVLSGQEVAALAGGRRRVSGYVHQLLDVAGLGTPAALLAALGDPVADGPVTVLRWTAVGPALYPTPYGGTDEERMAAVAGWVVEEPPFAGLGLGRNPDRVVREYKVDGVGLPHGAELWELRPDGTEHRRLVLDGDRPDRWCSYRVRWQGAEHAAVPDHDGERLRWRLRAGPSVPAEECADAAFVTAAGRCRGEPVHVHEGDGDPLVVEYAGGRAPAARAAGFTRVERGVWRARVRRAEVDGLAEVARPLGL